ncbi:MAG: XdhC family protein, partial [Microbacterium sp.]|uniref:XdhC family protein n=1 Tax=Microbacterium sp. TaxID=51671 RepID=UPI0039E5285F
MLDLAADLLPLLRAGETVAVVTVARVARSAPRGAGAAMAVTRTARVIGAISGGCVESDAVSLSLAALGRGRGEVSRLGFSDEQAFAAGLACGGSIDAVVSLVGPRDDVALAALERAASGRATAIGIRLSGPRTGEIVDPALVPGSAAVLARGETTTVSDGAGEVLVVCATPPPRLILLGAGEHAAALCRVGAAAGFAVTVCDVWDLLTTPERFPDAERLVTGIPHEYLRAQDGDDVDARTAICVLTHDVRLDVPAITAALRMPVGFVGAMGARSTVARRVELLHEAGVTDAELAALHSPLGLDLGGSSPEHTALAVLAEIVAVTHGGSARPLREGRGPLHRRAAAGPLAG